jgi:hypothetical protein
MDPCPREGGAVSEEEVVIAIVAFCLGFVTCAVICVLGASR